MPPEQAGGAQLSALRTGSAEAVGSTRPRNAPVVYRRATCTNRNKADLRSLSWLTPTAATVKAPPWLRECHLFRRTGTNGAQNSARKRPAKIETGPRSAL